MAALRTEFATLRADVNAGFRTQTIWMVGLLTGVIGLAVAIIKLFP